ncbi:MAG: lipopolysaccharide kinase InaA family protein [Sulfuricurvum sp.]|uniref:lipopolysaccharide kinase InaA family protein n=1 Tax=Sulfuricurvum sp. TaxID=2025608 RepID=UPI002626DADC|nr:lipopolysaccharide kinase InaA family protein [Sulfuricurvum sp.]MDD2828624.1 lipopolysaccharide kinase InaA family protein [Sulfuricurvum sp.]MDD4948301.1 lipopolysaccharide kinase InaA family protein [Sulfuricurvum sp.]
MKFSLTTPLHYAYLSDSLESIQTIFTGDNHSIHKARNELKIIEIEGIKTVVKSFKVPHLLNRIVYTYFRKSKAYKSYHNALRLKELNIATPEPIALIEFFESALLADSYFISEFFDYDFTIRTPLLEPLEDREAIFTAFATYTYGLHQKGVWHLDYSPGNILIKKTESGYQFSIVDINRMEFREISPLQGCENFNKLWASDEELEIMGREYARLSGFNVAVTIAEMKRHNDTNKRTKNFKKSLKRWLRGNFSTPA